MPCLAFLFCKKVSFVVVIHRCQPVFVNIDAIGELIAGQFPPCHDPEGIGELLWLVEAPSELADAKAVVHREEVLEGHKLAMMARNVQLKTSFRPVTLNGDRDKIRTIVDNLVSNAIKYSPDNSSMMVRLSADRAYAYIEVTDSGPGIPESERERVFEAFYQGKPADQGPVRGTGLGLSIAREYARAHGGDISVVECEHGVASLRVVLPLEMD